MRGTGETGVFGFIKDLTVADRIGRADSQFQKSLKRTGSTLSLGKVPGQTVEGSSGKSLEID